MKKIESKQELDAELGKSKRVLVLFYASWCPYCVRFVQVFDQKAKTLPVENVIHVLIDDYDNPLWDDYSIGAVPTIILFENAEVLSRLDGRLGSGLNEKQFKAWIETLKLA